jgi:hypothetical protein
MHILEKLSLDCGLRSEEPSIPLSYFPITGDKIIILENSLNNGDYPHFDEVAAYLSSLVAKIGYKIIQLKINPLDKNINKSRPYTNLTAPQFNWLIKNAELIVSNNPYSCATASALNINAIQIHKDFPVNSLKSIWGKARKINLKNNSKLYAEKIVKKALNLLGIENKALNSINPIFCGNNFQIKCLEVVPDFSAGELAIKNERINIRADYFYNQENILQLIHLNESNLITKKNVNTKLLNNPIAKRNLKSINFEVTTETQESEIEDLFNSNIDINLFCRDSENISDIRLNLIDYQINLEENIQKKELDIDGDICDNTCYKSSKILISKGKHYSSKAKWKKQQPLQKNSFETIIDSADFWQESEHFKLFNINNHG